MEQLLPYDLRVDYQQEGGGWCAAQIAENKEARRHQVYSGPYQGGRTWPKGGHFGGHRLLHT